MEAKIEVIRQFLTDDSKELTIRQISKLIKKSYAFTNKEVRELISTNVLNKKIVGAAILCSLNYSCERALGLLIMNSILEKEKIDKRLITKVNHLLNQIIEYIDSCFVFGQKIGVICQNEFNVKQRVDADILLFDRDSFKRWAKKQNLSDLKVVYGYEHFWKVFNDE